MSEALLPDTDAITRGTIEFVPYGSKWLVRMRRLDGSIRRELFRTAAEGWPFFQDCVGQMREALAARSPEYWQKWRQEVEKAQ